MKLVLILAAIMTAIVARPQDGEPHRYIRILKQIHDIDPEGKGFYRFSFETENGIAVNEEGTVINPGSDNESTAKQGSFAYTGPDNVPYSVSWIADDDGFRASGAHLPTPPPIPEEIQRALELISNSKSQGDFDDRGFPIDNKKKK